MAYNVCIDGQKVIGTFSTNDEADYINDDRNRRFYLDPGEKFNFNYKKASEGYKAREGAPCAGRYAWMRDNRQELIDNGILDTDQSRLKVDFVSHCGVIASMLKMGGQKDLVLGLAVTLYKGTYYLHATNRVTTVPGKAQSTQSHEERDSQLLEASTRLLLKFVTSRDGQTSDKTAPVNDNETFCAMMTVNCGNHPLLVCFEIQAEKRITDPPPDLPNLQNCMSIHSRNQKYEKIHPMKALKWWAPNVIAGIPEIYCGLRDDKISTSGLRDDESRTIRKIKKIKTEDLATNSYTKHPKTKQKCWDSGHCIRKLEYVLSQIKELVPEDDPNSFKRAVLTIRSVDGGSGMNTVEIQKRNGQEGYRFVEEDDIQLIFKGNE